MEGSKPVGRAHTVQDVTAAAKTEKKESPILKDEAPIQQVTSRIGFTAGVVKKLSAQLTPPQANIVKKAADFFLAKMKSKL